MLYVKFGRKDKERGLNKDFDKMRETKKKRNKENKLVFAGGL